MTHFSSGSSRWTEERRTSLFFWIGMLVVGAVSVYKAFFGFGGYDESFYLAVGDRIAQGDSLFGDEWNLAQMISVFTAPFVALFKRLAGSYEGVVLFSRLLYVFIHALTCVLAFHTLKRHGRLAVAGVLSLFLFTPFNLMAICYNTMSIDFLLASTLLLATAGRRKAVVFASGAFFACAVMCCPYLALASALYLLAAIALRLAGKTGPGKPPSIFGLGTFVLFSAGAASVAAAFFLFVLGRTSVGGMLENIPLMLEDPEHAAVGFLEKTKLYFMGIFESSRYFRFPLAAFVAMAAALALDRARRQRRVLYLAAAAAITLLAYLAYLPQVTRVTYNHIMFPMVFLGITSYCLLENKPRELFQTTFLGGILFGFCASLASNQCFYVISSATVVANVASFVFAGKLLDEIAGRPEGTVRGRRLAALARLGVHAAVVMLFALQFASKLNHCFWEPPRALLDTRLESCPGAGIFTTQDNASVYHALREDLASDPADGEKLLVLSEKTYLYLMAGNFEYATLSPWLGGGETQAALDRLGRYYTLHPDKIPTLVYIPKASAWDFAALLSRFADQGYAVQENAIAYRLRKPPSSE